MQKIVGCLSLLWVLAMLPVLASPEGMTAEQVKLLRYICLGVLVVGSVLLISPQKNEHTLRTA